MSDFQLKCTKFNFGWDYAPDPAHSAPPNLLAGFRKKRREGKREGEWKWG